MEKAMTKQERDKKLAEIEEQKKKLKEQAKLVKMQFNKDKRKRENNMKYKLGGDVVSALGYEFCELLDDTNQHQKFIEYLTYAKQYIYSPSWVDKDKKPADQEEKEG